MFVDTPPPPSLIEAVASYALDPAYLGSVVFPWINTGCALLSLLAVAYYAYKTHPVPASVAVAVPSVILCAVGYGLFALKVIDQSGLTTIVRPALPLLILSVGITCIVDLHRRKLWTTKLSPPSSKL